MEKKWTYSLVNLWGVRINLKLNTLQAEKTALPNKLQWYSQVFSSFGTLIRTLKYWHLITDFLACEGPICSVSVKVG